ncbi:ABC transporter permease [Hoeflea sp. TYP-13]|uniref:ABC transporter permease n=1 Tax=Hoeflea sp. TYP-13 TaxID=3230023 RepID=UPI0034C6D175
MDTFVFVFAGAFATATPLLLAAMGELVVERTGVLNLSVEGMMAISAAIAFMVVYTTGSHSLGFLIGAVSAAALSVIFAVLVLVFLANQVAAGLAVGILGLGLSALLARSFESETLIPLRDINLPVLSDLPVVGPILFTHDPVVYLTIAIGLVLAWMFTKTRLGLILRVVGENPEAAHNLGFSVLRTRFWAIVFGGCMAGLAGAYASTVLTPVWSQGMIAGRGWIAVALVVFGTWKPLRVMFGAYFFGAALLAELAVQSLGIDIPSQIMSSMPYALTILVLAAVSKDTVRIRLNAPVSLGENYRPSA